MKSLAPSTDHTKSGNLELRGFRAHPTVKQPHEREGISIHSALLPTSLEELSHPNTYSDMAEIDSYRPGGNYGGGRGYNKRKRGRGKISLHLSSHPQRQSVRDLHYVSAEDDEFNQQPYRNQHHRREAPPGSRLKRGLLDIGEDDRRRASDEAFQWAKLATDNYEDEYVRDTFTTVILKLVVEQAFKIPFVAAVVLYAHQEKKELAADVVAKAGEQLQEFLEKGQWKEVKLMLRFLASLSRLYEEDGVLPIMDELFSRAVDLQTASRDDVLGIELVKIILLTIPYLLAFASDTSLQSKVAELLERTDIVASAQTSLEPLVDPYPPMSEENRATNGLREYHLSTSTSAPRRSSKRLAFGMYPTPLRPCYKDRNRQRRFQWRDQRRQLYQSPVPSHYGTFHCIYRAKNDYPRALLHSLCRPGDRIGTSYEQHR